MKFEQALNLMKKGCKMKLHRGVVIGTGIKKKRRS